MPDPSARGVGAAPLKREVRVPVRMVGRRKSLDGCLGGDASLLRVFLDGSKERLDARS
jgi:hypothetical protein